VGEDLDVIEKRTIVIGDVHGCLDELDELLKLVQHDRGRDRLLFLGDLVDRGPDPVGVVRRAVELGAECLMGNHEEKHIRWAKWESKVARGEAAKNPMKPFSTERAAQNRELVERGLIDWIERLPLWAQVDRSWFAVHAGAEPGKPVENQDKQSYLRCRYINADGERHKEFHPTPECRLWPDAWDGSRLDANEPPASILYGHIVESLTTVHITWSSMANVHNVFTYGLDTGCCFGGRLSAALFHPIGLAHLAGRVLPEIVQVEARGTYGKWLGRSGQSGDDYE
jgi:diadenosine tetraphosphatase ApaH/serine/threonine PP2A family protein phosphatase